MGTMIIVYGFNSLYYDGVGGSPIAGFSESFSNFAQGFFRLGSFKLSYITIYAAICAFLVWVMWNKTRFGKNIFAIGGNPEAAKVSGVNVARNLVVIYMIAGMFYAFGGMLEAVIESTSKSTCNWFCKCFCFCMIFQLSEELSSANSPGMPHRAAMPTSVNTMRDQMDALPPSSQPTKSNWNSPTRPQLMPPTINRIRQIL